VELDDQFLRAQYGTIPAMEATDFGVNYSVLFHGRNSFHPCSRIYSCLRDISIIYFLVTS